MQKTAPIRILRVPHAERFCVRKAFPTNAYFSRDLNCYIIIGGKCIPQFAVAGSDDQLGTFIRFEENEHRDERLSRAAAEIPALREHVQINRHHYIGTLGKRLIQQGINHFEKGLAFLGNLSPEEQYWLEQNLNAHSPTWDPAHRDCLNQAQQLIRSTPEPA